MEIRYIECIDSTHLYLVQKVKTGDILPPYALYANIQTKGVGSRDSKWIGGKGNLHLSFCLHEDSLPKDVPNVSISIYFATILHEILKKKGSNSWIKWPNDFYLEEKKIGGVISTKIKDIYVVSMGINLLVAPENFAKLDINVSNDELVSEFFKQIKKKYSWKQVFSKFQIQFQRSKNFTFHGGDEIRSLKDAVLCDDGSININNEKVYSLR